MANSIKFSIEDLKRIAKNLLDFLDEKKITSLPDLERIMNKTFLIDKSAGEKILVEFRPSDSDTKTHTISYIVLDRGIPLDVKVNKELAYSRIIVKGDFTLQDYKPFVLDKFDNIIQDKKLVSANISQVKSELKKLVDYR